MRRQSSNKNVFPLMSETLLQICHTVLDQNVKNVTMEVWQCALYFNSFLLMFSHFPP